MANRENGKVEVFYQSLVDPENLDDAQLTDAFGYYLHGEGSEVFKAGDIERCFDACYLPSPSSIGNYLNKNSKGRSAKFIKLNRGDYKLARPTTEAVKSLLGDKVSKAKISKTLADLSSKFTDPIETSFLEESILCFRIGAHRAAIVMVWVLTVDHMYRYVLAHKLTDFQAALAKQTDKKVKSLVIKNRDDFAGLQESKFIEILKSAGIITNGVRKILNEKLGVRNDAAHPSTITFSPKKTEVFIEDLVNNVILKYPI